MRGWDAACANSTGSKYIWLIRCGGSGVGHEVSGPSVALYRSARDGIGTRESSIPVTVVVETTSFG
jgi:hypothetical protein